METEIAAHPGYVRLVLRCDEAGAANACRSFVDLCRKEGARRALILAHSSDARAQEVESHISAVARALAPGFRLAVVAHGSGARHLARTAAAAADEASGKAQLFRSEHQAAAWLMGE
jgi:hypothetical protein